MALMIRMRQQGRNNHRTFRLVVIESKQRRDGAYLECLGWYDPRKEQEQGLSIQGERVEHWLQNGAQLSERVAALLAKAAPEVYKRHLDKEQQKKRKATVKRRQHRQRQAAAARS